MTEKALNYLGLMRKADAVKIGETETGAAVRAQQATVVIVASDASENAVSRARGFVYGRNIPIVYVPFSKEDIAIKVGKSGCSMAAICDAGFADAFMKALCEINPEKYSEVSAQVSAVNDMVHKLAREKKAHEINRKNGKRRSNK